MRPEARYESMNFLWFAARYADFLYIDRVVVAQGRRRDGLASALYRDIESHAAASGAALLACEINVRPPNPESAAFHARHGFVEVGTQDTEGATKTVSLQIKRLTAR
jgi:predicted GNAT superfamily acetyltransferase